MKAMDTKEMRSANGGSLVGMGWGLLALYSYCSYWCWKWR